MKTKYWKLFLFFGIFAMIGAINGFLRLIIMASTIDKENMSPMRWAMFILIGISCLNFYFAFRLRRLHKEGIINTNKMKKESLIDKTLSWILIVVIALMGLVFLFAFIGSLAYFGIFG